jgi:hypothetical protein
MVDITNPLDVAAMGETLESKPQPTAAEVITSTAALDVMTFGGGALARQFFKDEEGYKVIPDMLPSHLRDVESLYRSGSPNETAFNIRLLENARDWTDTQNRSTWGQFIPALLMSPVNVAGYFAKAPVLARSLLNNTSVLKSSSAFAMNGFAVGAAYGAGYELGKWKSIGENPDYETMAINTMASGLFAGTLSGAAKLTLGSLSKAADMSTRKLELDILDLDSLALAQQTAETAPLANQAKRIFTEEQLNNQILSGADPKKSKPIIFKFAQAAKEELATQYTAFTQSMVGLRKLNEQLSNDLQKNGFSILSGQRKSPSEINAIMTYNHGKIQYLNDLTIRIKKEQASRLYEASTVNGKVDPWRITANWLTDSVAFTGIPRPLTNILQYKKKTGLGVDFLKRQTLRLSGNYDFKTIAVNAGIPNPESVLINSALERADVLKIDRILHEQYSAATQTSSNRYFGARSPSTAVAAYKAGIEAPESWAKRVVNDRLRGIQHSNPHEQTYADEFFSYFEKQEARLSASGQIGQQKTMADTILVLKEKIKGIQSELSNPNLPPESISHRNKRISDLQTQINGLKDDLKWKEVSKLFPKLNQEPYFSRIFDKSKIEANRDQLKTILSNNFLKNGAVRVYNVSKLKWEIMSINNDLAKANKAADKWIDNFLAEKDPLGATGMANLSKSNRLMERSLHINNSDILDFLVTDPMVVLKLYQNRISPKYHFDRLFEGKSIDEAWSDIEAGLIDDGLTRAEINRMGLDFKSLYFRTVGGVIRDPSAMNQQIANGLKRWASTTLLGSSGITATAEIGAVLAKHSFGDNLKVLGNTISSPEFRKYQQLIKEQYGEAFEINMGSLASRVYDDAATKMTSGVWDKMENIYFNMTGLGPVTQTLKLHEGMVYIHELLGIAQNITNKKVSKFDMDLWTRFGLSIDDAAQIARAPIQMDGKIRMTDMDEWIAAGISEDVSRKWKLAVNQSISQTIITGGANDRPLISDGIIYIKKSVASKVPYLSNVPEDSIMQGYIRIESPLLTLPFQFMNWTFGAMNKLQANIAHDGLRNRLSGMVAMLGMGYMVAQLKTPNFVWDKMDDEEKFTAAAEYSGIVGIYGDLASRSLQFAQQIGGDISMSPLQPRFQSEPSAVGAIATVAGPAISNVVRLGNAVGEIGENPSKSLSTGYKLLPFTQAIGIRYPLELLSAPFK